MSFWQDNFLGSAIRQLGYNASGGIIGTSETIYNADGTIHSEGKPVTMSDVFASVAYVLSGTPQGQQFIAESAGSYVGAGARNNGIWLTVCAVMTAIIIWLIVKDKK